MKRLYLAAAFAAVSFAASAADVATKAAPMPLQPTAAVVRSWEGPFFGMNIGYGQTVGDQSIDGFAATDNKKCKYSGSGHCYKYDKSYHPLDGSSIPGAIPGDADGLTVGGVLGYRKQLGQMTIGGLVDWEWANIHGNQSAAFGAGFANLNTKITNLGTAVAELGFAPGTGTTLFAVQGGFAWGTVKRSLTATVGGPTMASESSTRTGWTLGGIVETQLRDQWTLLAGYRYIDLGSSTNVVSYSDGVNTYSNNVNSPNHAHEVRVGFHKYVNFGGL